MTTTISASDVAAASEAAVPHGDTIRSHHVRARVALTAKYVSLVVACLVTLLPLVVIIFNSLKTNDELFAGNPLTLPHNWVNFSNYKTAYVKGHMLRGLINTSIILVIGVGGSILIGSMTAYAIDRFDFRFRRTVVALFLLATLVPGVTTQVATFHIINNLGLFNTRWSAIVLYLGTDIISIYIFVQFLRGIPRDLDEAAELDGANKFMIFWRIIFPLLKPAIATVVIIKGIAIYNDFFIPYLYMPDPELGTVSLSLFYFKGPFGAQWEVISAGVIIVIVPTLVVFLLLQRFIYNGFTTGATK